MKRWLALLLPALLLAAGCSARRVPSVPSSADTDPTTPAGVIVQYFTLTAAGDYSGAYALLHPKAQHPNPVTDANTLKQAFLAQKPGSRLTRVVEAVALPEPDGWKFYGCQCYVYPAVEAKLELAGGNMLLIHLAKTDTGVWRLFWSPQAGLE